MFTGIIQAVGTVTEVEQRNGDVRLVLNAGKLALDDVKLGDSIACNGVCLTVVDLSRHGFAADVSQETLNLTTLGGWDMGSPVNLEKSVTLQDRLGGHLVSGHVDGVGEVLERKQLARAEWFQLRAPRHLAHYIAFKGSIAIDGTSLTVNEVNQDTFAITIVPHTLEETLIGGYQPGTQVNLEVDQIARYLERLQTGRLVD